MRICKLAYLASIDKYGRQAYSTPNRPEKSINFCTTQKVIYIEFCPKDFSSTTGRISLVEEDLLLINDCTSVVTWSTLADLQHDYKSEETASEKELHAGTEGS